MDKKEEKKDVLSHIYESLRNYLYFLTFVIILEMIGVVLLLVTFSRMMNEMKQIGFDTVFALYGFFALTLIGISIWVLLQSKKVIDFLFDLAEEKADISHKH